MTSNDTFKALFYSHDNFSIASYLRNAQVTLAEKPQLKKQFKETKAKTDKAFKGTVVNRTLSSLHGGHLKLRLQSL